MDTPSLDLNYIDTIETERNNMINELVEEQGNTDMLGKLNSVDLNTYGNSNYSYINTRHKYYIIYNVQFNIVQIISDYIYIKELLPELEVVNMTNPIDQNILLEYINKIENTIFIDKEDAINFINNNILINRNINKPSIASIIEFINTTYTITNDIDDKILFTDIFNIIIVHFKIYDTSYKRYMKNKLPYILQDLQLQKKRYSKGIYWYGLHKIN
jgi:hypothetical protein